MRKSAKFRGRTCASSESSVERRADPRRLSAFFGKRASTHRAQEVVSKARELDIDWPLWVASMQADHQMWVPCYEIPGSDFGAEANSSEASYSHKGHGIGLNWGSLMRLGRACEAGRALFTNGWPSKINKQLATPQDHLPTIEEIIWLSSWQDVTAIETEVKPWKNLGIKKSIDWKFRSCGQTINLEVKYRARDWLRVTDGPEFSIARPSYYEDVDGKFLESLPGELNLVGISSYASPDRSWREETHDYLVKNPQIDAIILWVPSLSGDDGKPFEIHSRDKAPLIRALLRIVEEDKQHLVIVRHLWQERDQRKVDGKAHVDEAKKSYAERALRRALGSFQDPASGDGS